MYCQAHTDEIVNSKGGIIIIFKLKPDLSAHFLKSKFSYSMNQSLIFFKQDHYVFKSEMSGNMLFPAVCVPHSFALFPAPCAYILCISFFQRCSQLFLFLSLLSSLGQLSFFHLSVFGAPWNLPHSMIASTLLYALRNISWELLIDPKWGILSYKAVGHWWRNVKTSLSLFLSTSSSSCSCLPNQADPQLRASFSKYFSWSCFFYFSDTDQWNHLVILVLN